MELYAQIMAKILDTGTVEVRFPDLDINSLLENECYKALNKIRDIVRDEELDDDACFEKIEEIVNVFDKIGSDGGYRHDFG